MPDKYWVSGGSGNWNDNTITTNWASTSGGSRIASPPAAGDNVFFDGNSGNPTVTVQSSVTLVNFQLLGPCTLTLGQNLTLSGTLTINDGSLNTSTFNLVAASFASSGAVSRTLTLGSGTHTFSAASTAFITSGTNFTLNGGTSTVQLSSNNATLSTQGLTFNNVSFTSTAQATPSISGANTFNNLTITGRTGVGVALFDITGKQIINGTLTLSAGSISPARTFIKSSVIGQQVELQVNSFAATNDIDFRDIAITGNAVISGPIDATLLRFGNCQGNNGINFATGKTVWFRAAGSANWGATGTGSWSFTQGGGATDANAFPLAQDTAAFPIAPTPYPSSGNTVTINAAYNIGTIDMSRRTSITMTLAFGTQNPVIYGNLVAASGVTYTGTGSSPIVFAGRTTQNITSATKIFTRPISIDSPGGTVVLTDAFESSNTSDSSLVSGTWNLNGYTTTIRAHFIATGTNTREIAFGGSNLVIGSLRTSGTVWDATVSTNLTLSGGGTITLQTVGGGSPKTFAGGNYQNYPTVDLGANVTIYGTGLTITGSNKFQNITNTTLQGGSLRFTGGQTNEFVNFSATGTPGNRLILRSTNTVPTTLIKPTTWFMGANSTNIVGNTGLTFTAGGGIDYLDVSYINGVAGGTTYLGTVEETATGTDGVSSSGTFLTSVVESATATDSVAVIVTLNAETAETATASDIAEAVAATVIAASIDEQATAVDVVVVAPSTFGVPVAEVASALDSLGAALSYNVQFVDSTTATDDVQRTLIFVGAVVEQAAASDVAEAVFVFAAQVLETTTATDVTLVAPSTYGPQVAEALAALDSLGTQASFSAQFVDLTTIFDGVIGADLWNLIDDSQTANWQNVGNTQTPGWVDVNDAQTPGWTPVNT